ncbi:hypothetical protein GCM10011386_14770 [Parapedobacter defluvii]|uniref:DUF5007 domain-containing protein n=1 Tax=Parapedobacter defluvii TaxID=2045106 RepID=A0ABQ1LFN3_9SPHI|nr:DUF5007 domain-containing protein [Parapedobacter defluvii]GGC23843.1 hypothetical protein GCM10011386_14770 [Parapedobacter defluvii]
MQSTKKIINRLYSGTLFTFGLFMMVSCVDIPKEGSIAPDINYRNRKQQAVAGLAQSIGDFQVSTSTLPLYFEIANITETNGNDVSALLQEIPVIQYTKPIVGDETDEELALKTDTARVPAVTINQHTGRLQILEGNNIRAGEYHFDIKVSNSSGTRLLKDALVIEFAEYELKSWSGMTKAPEIERVGDAPNQILFVGYRDGVPLHGNRIDFTQSRALGFKGTFVDDTEQGEIWNVDFPVKESTTYCNWKVTTNEGGAETDTYENAEFNFVLGREGSYVIRLYK